MLKSLFKKRIIELSLLVIIGIVLAGLIGEGIIDAFHTPSIGFTVNSDMVVTYIEEGGAASVAGMKVGDRIISIDNNPVTEGALIAEHGRNVKIGEESKYNIERNDQNRFILSLKWQPNSIGLETQIVINGVISFLLLILATVVYIRNPDFSTAKLYYVLMLFYIFFRMNHPRFQNEVGSRMYQTVYLMCFFMIPAVFGHFCSRFPRRNLFLYHKHGRIFWLYGPSIILFFPSALVHWTHYGNFKATGLITQFILIQGFILWAIFLFVGVLMMLNSFLRIRSKILSRRCIVVFYALIVAVLPYILASFLSSFHGKVFDIITMIVFLPFPFTLAWAIAYGEDKSEGIPWIMNQFFHSKN